MDSLSIAASGIRSAEVRMAASAHNVANLMTDSFRPLRVAQTSVASGGSTAHVHREPDAREVDLLHEIVQQMQASHQFNASLRFFETASEMRGRLVDLLA